MRITLLYLLLVLSVTALAQKSDSLWNVWENVNESDTNRLKALGSIIWRDYMYSNPDSAFILGALEVEFAKDVGNIHYEATGYNNQGVALHIKGEYDQSILFFNKALPIRMQGKDRKGEAIVYNNLGLVYHDQGNYKMAIEVYMKSLKIKEELNNQKGRALTIGNIALVYQDMGDLDNAMEFHQQSLDIRKEIGDKRGEAMVLNNIGLIYMGKNMLDESIRYFKDCYEIVTELNDNWLFSDVYNNLGLAYFHKGEYDKAMSNYEQCLLLRRDLGDQEGIANLLNNIGNIYAEKKDIKQAVKYSEEALSIAREIGSIIRMKGAAQSLYKYYKEINRPKESLEMYELAIKMRDSLDSEENTKAILEQEFKYSYEKQAAADSVKNAEAQKVKDAQLQAEKAENKQHQIEAEQQRQQAYFLYGGLGLALLFGGVVFNRFRITRKQKNIIEDQKGQVDKAFEELEEKNREIMDSIKYAKRIQSAILPPSKLVKEYLEDSFILYKPKDIVAGDFYWMEVVALQENRDSRILFAAADCTGHGVPGAMVSVVCNNGLNRSVREHGLTDPGEILNKTREIVIQEFEKSEEEVKDGMDIALCSLELLVPGSMVLSSSGSENVYSGEIEEPKTQNSESGTREPQTVAKLQFAGAHNPLWIIRNGTNEVEEIKADKQPIGKFDHSVPYTTHTVQLQKGDTIYIFTDGYADQFGGENLAAGRAGGKKLKSSNFKKLLLSIQHEPMLRQRELIDEAFENWRGEMEQIDDVCVIGVRI